MAMTDDSTDWGELCSRAKQKQSVKNKQDSSSTADLESSTGNNSTTSGTMEQDKYHTELIDEDMMMLAKCTNSDGQLEATVTLSQSHPQTDARAGTFYIPPYEINVQELLQSEVKIMTLRQRSPVVPAIAFHPFHPEVLAVSSYAADGNGVSVTMYNVTSGAAVWSRDFRDIHADWDAIVNVCFSKNGSRLVICVKEETNNVLEYLARFFVVDLVSLREIHRSGALLLRVCHRECVLNAKPRVTKCGGFIKIPSSPDVITEKLPEEETLKEIARKSILQALNNTHVESALKQFDIPRDLNDFLTFK